MRAWIWMVLQAQRGFLIFLWALDFVVAEGLTNRGQLYFEDRCIGGDYMNTVCYLQEFRRDVEVEAQPYCLIPHKAAPDEIMRHCNSRSVLGTWHSQDERRERAVRGGSGLSWLDRQLQCVCIASGCADLCFLLA